MFKKRYIRLPLIVMAACLAMLLAIWAAAGPLAKPQVAKWLKAQGAESATIQSLVFNPFRPSLQMKAMTVNVGNRRPLFLERVYVRLSWLGLLRKQVHVRNVEIQSLQVAVHQSGDALTIGGLTLAAGGAGDSPQKRASNQTAWHLRLDDLVISSSRVDLVSPDFKGTLALDQASLNRGVLGRDGVSGVLTVKGLLNEAPLRINAQVEIKKGKGAVKGKLNLSQLPLAKFHPLMAEALSRLQGTLSLETQWEVAIDGPAIALDQSLKMQLADLEAETQDMILGQKQGAIQIDLAARTQGQDLELAHIKRLALNDAHLAVTLKKKVPQGAHPALSGGGTPADDRSPVVSILIDLVEVTGDTRIAFSDRNLDPAFDESLRHLNLKMTDLDNREQDKPSPFILSAEIQKYGKLSCSGALKPFSRNLYVDLTGRLSQYELPRVSGYTQSLLGYHVRTGQLNANLALKIENRLLDGQTQLDLKALKLIPSANSTSDKLTKQVTMPLDLALGYISDDKGNLQLKMPIKGSLDDPEFGISHLCQIVMVKAAKSAAYAYLKAILLPYGALVRIGVDLAVQTGQKMMALELAPLVYPPAQLQPGPESETYIDQLVALLAKEPNMRLIICSVAAPADLATPKGAKISDAEKEKQLLALAKARMDHFKQMLVETHGIESDRLLDCYPRVDHDPGAAPRIEIDL